MTCILSLIKPKTRQNKLIIDFHFISFNFIFNLFSKRNKTKHHILTYHSFVPSLIPPLRKINLAIHNKIGIGVVFIRYEVFVLGIFQP